MSPVEKKKKDKRRPMIVAKGVTKEFMIGKEPYHALKGVSATIYEAEFAIIYGPSGSGKSTLLNTLIGLEKPTSGEIWVDGIEIDKMTEDQRADLRANHFGVVSQQPIWIKALTVMENVMMPLLIANVSESAAKQKAIEVLTQVGLLDWAKHKPTELSGGQQQRVNFARSLVSDPHILVLDEPTGNLDSIASDMVLSLLQDLNRQRKRTIVMITHNLEYLPLADRTIMVRDGLITKILEQEGKKLVQGKNSELLQ
jgi:putative ABC transport system ATP-binding protein